MPSFKLKCEGLHPIHCLKQMFITFFHTLKRNLEWIPDLTTLTNLRRFQILLFPPKRYLKSAIMGRQKTKKGQNKYSTFQSEQLPARHSLAGRQPAFHWNSKYNVWVHSAIFQPSGCPALPRQDSPPKATCFISQQTSFTRLFLKTELKPVSEAYHQRHSFYTHSLDHS